jgi:RNA polymerase sigma-70 factor (ECF subfamily)
LESVLDPLTRDPARTALPSTTAVYDSHGQFVWVTLQRLGARPVEIEDLFQEVFVVVHRRLESYDNGGTLSSWLFGICVRVVSAHRRRAYLRRERVTDPNEVPEPPTQGISPEEHATRKEARAQLEAILDELDLDKRAVFVMFELEALSCEQIAEAIGVPVGTVYSRLHAARRSFEQALARMRARDAHGSRR